MENSKPTKEELEEFKKNWMQRIEGISKDKTAWIEDFKEVYQQNREAKQEPLTVKYYANRLQKISTKLEKTNCSKNFKKSK